VSVAIIDYGSGNLRSAANAFQRAASSAGETVLVTADPDEVRRADRIVLPGVGAFADCRRGLDAIPGMVDTLEEEVRRRGKPFLGICVGSQLMAERGVEKEISAGLSWIAGDVVEITPADPALKIPHMGWNSLQATRPHELLAGIPTGDDGWDAYFVHSFHIRTRNPSDQIAIADYGGPVTAIVGRDNYAGTQFHPEKSQKLGLALIANFLRWRP
jgi:imidazole glycerol-phosphate synthase subunit HisH